MTLSWDQEKLQSAQDRCRFSYILRYPGSVRRQSFTLGELDTDGIEEIFRNAKKAGAYTLRMRIST